MKKILISFLVFFLLLAGGIVSYLALFDINSYKGMIEKSVGEAIGHSVYIGGELELKKSLRPVLIINNIEVRNGKEGLPNPNLALINQARVSLDLLALLDKKININDVQIQGGKLFLEVTKEEKTNKQVSNKKESKGVSSSSKPTVKQSSKPKLTKKLSKDVQILVDAIRVADIDVYYNDEQRQKKWEIKVTEGVLSKLSNLEAKIKWNEETFTLSGVVKNLQNLFQEKSRALSFSFDVLAYQAKTKISANIQDVQSLNDLTINIKTEGENLRDTLATVNLYKNVPSLPFSMNGAIKITRDQTIADISFMLRERGAVGSFYGEFDKEKAFTGKMNVSVNDENVARIYGIKPFTLNTKISSDKEGEFNLTNFMFMANESDIDGELKIVLGKDRPFITGKLTSRYLNVEDIFAQDPMRRGTEYSNNDSERARLFTSSPIKDDFLTVVDLNVGALIENLNVNGMLTTYPRLMLNVRLKEGDLIVSFLEGTQVLGGSAVGVVEIQKQGVELEASANMVAEELKLDNFTVLKDHLQKGNFSVNVHLKTKGNSAQQLAGNMNGQFLMRVQDSEIFSKWLSKLPVNIFQISKRMLPYQQTYSNTISLKCAVFDINIQDGVIKLDRKVAMETNLFNIILDGTINLKNEELDIQMIPTAPKGKTTETMNLASQFVTIGGTLMNPMPRPAVVKSAQQIMAAVITNGISIPTAQVVKKVIEDPNPCRTVMKGMKLKTIDEYMGRSTTPVEKSEEASKEAVVVQPKSTKVQKFGEELLNSLSNVLMRGGQEVTELK